MNPGIQYSLNRAALDRLPPREPMSRKRYLDEMLATLDSREIEQVIRRVEPIYHGAVSRRPA